MQTSACTWDPARVSDCKRRRRSVSLCPDSVIFHRANRLSRSFTAVMSVNCVHCEYTEAGESQTSGGNVSDPGKCCNTRPHVSLDKCLLPQKARWQVWMSPNCEASMWRICVYVYWALCKTVRSTVCLWLFTWVDGETGLKAMSEMEAT